MSGEGDGFDILGKDTTDGVGVAPIQTKMRTSYLRSRDDQWENEDRFIQVPRQQQYQSFQPAVMSRKAFGPVAQKPNIDQFRATMLTVHNNYRVRHGISPLKLNDALNQKAQKWADTLAEYNILNNSDDNDYGENLFASNFSHPNPYPTAEEVCDSWYNEIKLYEFGQDPPDSANVQHFTQMVWRITTELGVGMAKSVDGVVFVVAKYSPRGNTPDQYASNVFPSGPQQATETLERSYQAVQPQPISSHRGNQPKLHRQPVYRSGISRPARYEGRE